MTLATVPAPQREAVVAWPPATPWVRACVLAESIGITAAALAAVLAHTLGAGTPARYLVVVAGGLVEGAALGLLQAKALGPGAGRRLQRRWALVTLLFAGLAWASSSSPSVQEGGTAAGGPALVSVLVGAAGLGGLMGLLLGAAQVPVLRGLVVRPWRWAGVSALAWAPAMTVIFAGASLPTAAWPGLAVVLLGPPTGALAGLVLGTSTVLLARLGGLSGIPRR